jgi:hypothetical protein
MESPPYKMSPYLPTCFAIMVVVGVTYRLAIFGVNNSIYNNLITVTFVMSVIGLVPVEEHSHMRKLVNCHNLLQVPVAVKTAVHSSSVISAHFKISQTNICSNYTILHLRPRTLTSYTTADDISKSEPL